MSQAAVSASEDVVLRSLDRPEEFKSAEGVQIETWGYSDRDVVPAAMFSVARHFGGQALGAFLGERMIGFALAFAALDGEHAHLHSHMVAVVPEFQGLRVGRRIKLAQRQDALARGIGQIGWTFDPLQMRNAHFNLVRLGAIGVRYLPNLYGTTSSPLHGAMPTDRLLMEWNLESEHVHQALNGEPALRSAEAQVVPIPETGPHVPLPQRLSGQQRLREHLMALLQDGYVVVGQETTQSSSQYILARLSAGSWRQNAH